MWPENRIYYDYIDFDVARTHSMEHCIYITPDFKKRFYKFQASICGFVAPKLILRYQWGLFCKKAYNDVHDGTMSYLAMFGRTRCSRFYDLMVGIY